MLRGCVTKRPVDQRGLIQRRRQQIRSTSLFPICCNDTGGNLNVRPLVSTIAKLFRPVKRRKDTTLYNDIFGIRCASYNRQHICLQLCDKALHLQSAITLTKERGLGVARVHVPSGKRVIQASATCPNRVIVLPDSDIELGSMLKSPAQLPHGE